jgi:glycine dehydrogenase subunit 1
VTLPAPAGAVLQTLKAQGILAGLDLGEHYPELGNALLVCATETKIAADLKKYVEHLDRVLA